MKRTLVMILATALFTVTSVYASNSSWPVTAPPPAWLPARSWTKEAAGLFIALMAQQSNGIEIRSVMQWIGQFFDMVNIHSTGDNIIFLNSTCEQMRKRIKH